MLKTLLSQITQTFTKSETTQSTTTQNTSASLSSDKIKAVVADLTNADELFQEAGFIMQQLQIEVGFEPKITPQFSQFKILSKEDEKQLLMKLENRKMIQFILISLFKSAHIKAMLEGSKLCFHAVEIDITTSPTVKTIFKREASPIESASAQNQDDQITRH